MELLGSLASARRPVILAGGALSLSVLVLATPDDRLVPIRGVRSTAARYAARVEEFPGMGHDLMLDARWREPLAAMLDWLPKATATA